MVRLLCVGIIFLLISGCASYGVVENLPTRDAPDAESYSIRSFMKGWRTKENALMLAFSGGGTRAAALSYGVLKELKNTPIVLEGQTKRLLDEVGTISSVSGGSFTSAYYGLHGDGIFNDFEDVFLRQNVEGALIRRLFNPFRWFSTKGRTEMAVNYYEKTVFKGATFADMRKQGGPMIVINASDLGRGVRFSFVQEYFNLLCSDLASYPVARAVTASSAVPLFFNPVVVENHPECGTTVPDWLKRARDRAIDDPEMAMVVAGAETYFDRDKREYVHFVDGGITDNLGLRAVYDVFEVSGGIAEFMKKYDRPPPRRLVLISVNASTAPEPVMDRSRKRPSMKETINAMSDAQLHHYNVATIALMKQSMQRWAQELSAPERPVTPYFIRLDFSGIKAPERRRFFNQTPTSFNLTDEQVDKLIEAGGELLRNDPEFRRLLNDLEDDRRKAWNGVRQEPGNNALLPGKGLVKTETAQEYRHQGEAESQDHQTGYLLEAQKTLGDFT